MDIKEFFSTYTTPPVLFIGTGISLRYLDGAKSWIELLKSIFDNLDEDEETWLTFLSECDERGEINCIKLGTKVSVLLDSKCKDKENRNEYCKGLVKIWMQRIREGQRENLSFLKIAIAEIIKLHKVKEDCRDEIRLLIGACQKVSSIITTNYDSFIENTLGFDVLVGNNILLSNPFHSVYKIHGCHTNCNEIIIDESDYDRFNRQYELIRAQLISLFCHNPIIFIGYGIGDDNIKKVLKTIFSYVKPNTELARKVKRNFLLIQYEEDSDNVEIESHSVECGEGINIDIHKLSTDNFSEVYRQLAQLNINHNSKILQFVYQEADNFLSGKEISIDIADDYASLSDNKKGIAFGNVEQLRYVFENDQSMITNYFSYVSAGNKNLVRLIDRMKIHKNHYFPIFGYSTIYPHLKCAENLKKNQRNKIKQYTNKCIRYRNQHTTIESIMNDAGISRSYKNLAIFYAVYNRQINLEKVESYLKKKVKMNTDDKVLLCLYDMIKYGGEHHTA